ncbi:MAG: phage shock protein operon transcriptional activator [Candidatus Sumerlaeota bacterium]|nr:phage shock protein operon transcriptional activator [Candidatus Sumerlaeota bacterium]
MADITKIWSESDGESAFEAIGQAAAFLDFQEQLRRVAPVERPVLLIGERGTGKELAARRLHYLSKRWQRPFVTLHCAALAPTLIESELFGHEAGAFTGARERRIGRFEAANSGTLFLDEVSLIPIETQEKILRVVEYGSFERVGSVRPEQVDARIIGATNADLAGEAARGRFKQDLLDRLSFEVLFLPPLRERREDIPLLAQYFAGRMALELGRKEIPEFSEEAMQRLLEHPWPGNIRELKNTVERATYRTEGALIERVEFDPFRGPFARPVSEFTIDDLRLTNHDLRLTNESSLIANISSPMNRAESSIPNRESSIVNRQSSIVNLNGAIEALEIDYLRRALQATRYNQRRAAEWLGLTYHQFRGLYRKHANILQTEFEK